MSTVFDAMLAVMRRLGEGSSGLADAGGSATAMVDAQRNEADDYWNGGTIFFIDAVSGTSILNRAFTVTDFTNSTHTVNFSTLSWTPAANTVYEIFTQRFTLPQLIQAMNAALDIMEVPEYDASTAVTGAIRYTLPTGVDHVRRVEIGNTTDGWEEHHHWREEDGYLMFNKDEPTDTSDYIRLTYVYRWSGLTGGTEASPTYQDTQLVDIDFNRLVMETAANLLRSRVLQVGADEPRTMELLKIYEGELARARSVATQRVKHSVRFATW